MEIIDSESELKKRIHTLTNAGKIIGFVPTMGNLHEGHISLIKIALENSDVIVCSIYVNPAQFNDKKDFELYPKSLSNDLKVLKKSGCNIVFTPNNNTIYPNGLEHVTYNIGQLGNVMEGKYRKGHFNGVIQVVKRLFDIVQPDVAVFGKKDFQQLTVIIWMVGHFNLDVKIISAPIIRDPDGVAMSSRNSRLSRSDREVAKELSKTLFFIRDNYKNIPILELKSNAIDQLNNVNGLELEYLEIADIFTLQPISKIDYTRETGVFVAAKVGQIRLIDNVGLF